MQDIVTKALERIVVRTAPTRRRRSTTRPPRSTRLLELTCTDDLGTRRLRSARSPGAASSIIAEHQHVGGAYPASPTFPVYRYSLAARRRVHRRRDEPRRGRLDSADAFFGWCAGVITARAARITVLVARAAARRADRGRRAPADPLHPRRRRGRRRAVVGLPARRLRHLAVGARRRTSRRHGRLVSTPCRRAVEPCADVPGRVLGPALLRLVGGARRRRHPSTLARDRRRAAGGGRRSSSTTPSPSAVPAPVDDDRRRSCSRQGIVDGHLVKWLGAGTARRRQPARLRHAVRRRRPPAARSPRRTYRKIVDDLAPDGVHRYLRRHVLRRRRLGPARRLRRLVRGRHRPHRRGPARGWSGCTTRPTPTACCPSRSATTRWTRSFIAAWTATLGPGRHARCSGRTRCTSRSPTRWACSMAQLKPRPVAPPARRRPPVPHRPRPAASRRARWPASRCELRVLADRRRRRRHGSTLEPRRRARCALADRRPRRPVPDGHRDRRRPPRRGERRPPRHRRADDLAGRASPAIDATTGRSATGSRWRSRLRPPATTDWFAACAGALDAGAAASCDRSATRRGSSPDRSSGWSPTRRAGAGALRPRASAPASTCVGFGERFDALDQRGRRARHGRVRAVQAAGPPHLPAVAVRHRRRRRRLGVPRAHVAARAGSTSAPPIPTACRRGRRVDPAEPAPSTCGSTTATAGGGARRPPRRGRRPALPAGVGVPAVDERQRVEHPGAGAGRGRAQRRARHPGRRRRHRGVERRVDVHRVPRRPVRGPPRRRAALARRLRRSPPTAPGPTRPAWSTGSTSSASRCCCGRSRWCPTDRGDDGQVAADAATMVERGYCVARGGRHAVPQPGLVVPRRAAARLDQPRRRRLVARQAPLPGRRGRHRRLQDRRRRARLGRRPALRRRHPRRRANNLYPAALRRGVPPPARRLRRRRRDVQPGRVHRRRLGAVPLGRRRGLDVGGVPGVDHRRADRRRSAACRSGAGTSPASPARSRRSSCTCGRRRWPRCARSCSTTASSTTDRQPSNDRTPWNIAERHGDERALDAVPPLRRAARAAACRTSSRGRADRRDRRADDAAAVLRPPRRPHGLGRARTQYQFGDDCSSPRCARKGRRASTSTSPPGRGSTPGRARATSARHGCHEQSRGTRSRRTSAPTGRQPCSPRSSICPASRSA